MYEFLTPFEYLEEQVVLPFKYDIAFTAKAVDTRGEVSRFTVQRNSKQQIDITYNHKELSVSINDDIYDLISFFTNYNSFQAKNILFDATNLSFAEIAVVMRLLIDSKSADRVSFIYAEPEKYSMKIWSPLEVRGFDLSKKIHTVDFIPTFYNRTLSSRKNYLLAFLGFEDIRLSKALDPDNGADFDAVSAVFSVPPFQIGWDTYSLMANSRVLKEQKLEEAFFAAGNQPYEAYQLIEKAIKFTSNGYNFNLTLAPFGTKPTSVAVALAAAKNKEISVLFDFPEKQNNRSEGVGKIHYYPITIDNNCR